MKNVGIITLYYKNDNYGGVAQAYALNRYINNIGYSCEMISYDKKKSNLKLDREKKDLSLLLKKIRRKANRILKAPIEEYQNKKVENLLKIRSDKLEAFRESIPHSQVYTLNNINSVENKYDIFITGSDQCWKPGLIDDAMVFNVVKNKKNIFSYASSIATDEFSEEYKRYMINSLKKYKNISVREESSKENLKKILNRDVEWVADPTLLLNVDEWNEVTSERIVNGDYIFSYILGDSINQRKKIKEFAKRKKMKLVTIPHIKKGCEFSYKLEDYKFGDIQMLDLSFGDFLSLIKNATYIITDSFHAICFSYIFRRNFYVLERKSFKSMNNRIVSMLNLLNLQERLVKELPLVNNDKINFEEKKENVNGFIEKSKSFLDSALKQ